jgi:hypothetical protein
MIPITKNIAVLGGSGQTLEPTYTKRAKGLVKHGRARWVNENTIALTCPPFNNKEDTHMDNMDNKVSDQFQEAQTPQKGNREASQTPDYAYIMAKIDEINVSTAYITEAMELLKNFQINESVNGGYGDQARAEAIGKIVEVRETTNQQMLGLLRRMLDSLLPPAPPPPPKTPEEINLEQLRFNQFTQMMTKLIDNADLDDPTALQSLIESAAEVFRV